MAATSKRSKAVDIALWVLSIAGAALFLTIGAYKFADGMHAHFDALGFPPGFDAGIGVLEMTGGFCLLFKRTAGWAALGLIVLMIGGVWLYAIDGAITGVIVLSGVIVGLGLIVLGRGLPVRTKEPPPVEMAELGLQPRGPDPES